MATPQEQLTAMIAPVVDSLACELWGLEYMGGGRDKTLRIYIDKKEGVGVEDCEAVSRQVSAILDVEDPIAGEYTLEVSSPGLERPLYTLAQYTAYVGEQIAVKLRVPFDGRRKFKGRLSGIENEDIVLVVDDHEFLLPIDAIEKANVVPQF